MKITEGFKEESKWLKLIYPVVSIVGVGFVEIWYIELYYILIYSSLPDVYSSYLHIGAVNEVAQAEG